MIIVVSNSQFDCDNKSLISSLIHTQLYSLCIPEWNNCASQIKDSSNITDRKDEEEACEWA